MSTQNRKHPSREIKFSKSGCVTRNFFRAGEFSWSRGVFQSISIKNHLKLEKERPRREKFSVFSSGNFSINKKLQTLKIPSPQNYFQRNCRSFTPMLLKIIGTTLGQFV